MQSKRTLISMEKHYLSEQRTDKAENLQMAAFSSHQHFKGEVYLKKIFCCLCNLTCLTASWW